MTDVKYKFETGGQNIVGVIRFGEKGDEKDFIVGYILELNGKITRKLVTYTGATKDSPFIMATAAHVLAGKSMPDAFKAGMAELGSAAPPIPEAELLKIGDFVEFRDLKFDSGMFLTGIRKTKKGGRVTYEFITRDATGATKNYSILTSRSSEEDMTVTRTSYKECDPQKVVALIEDQVEGPDNTFETSINVTCVVPPSSTWLYFMYAIIILILLYCGVAYDVIPRKTFGLAPLSKAAV